MSWFYSEQLHRLSDTSLQEAEAAKGRADDLEKEKEHLQSQARFSCKQNTQSTSIHYFRPATASLKRVEDLAIVTKPNSFFLKPLQTQVWVTEVVVKLSLKYRYSRRL